MKSSIGSLFLLMFSMLVIWCFWNKVKLVHLLLLFPLKTPFISVWNTKRAWKTHLLVTVLYICDQMQSGLNLPLKWTICHWAIGVVRDLHAVNYVKQFSLDSLHQVVSGKAADNPPPNIKKMQIVMLPRFDYRHKMEWHG